MKILRTATDAALLFGEAGIVVMGVVFYYGFTADYGGATDSTFEWWTSGFGAGAGAGALLLGGLAGLVAVLVSWRHRLPLTFVAMPVLMVIGMMAVTPSALREKLDTQYDATPQCVSDVGLGPGPGSRAERESQDAFDSIEHVGHFGGGGASGVGGCDRAFVLTEDVDVLQHYRTALRSAGWRVVEDDTHHLRAERDGMAFEVVRCEEGGVVWSGRVGDGRAARCDQQY